MRAPFTSTSSFKTNHARSPDVAATIIFHQTLVSKRSGTDPVPRIYDADVISTALAAIRAEVCIAISQHLGIPLSTVPLTKEIQTDYAKLEQGCSIALPTLDDEYFDVMFVSTTSFTTRRYLAKTDRVLDVSINPEYLLGRGSQLISVKGDGYPAWPIEMYREINSFFGSDVCSASKEQLAVPEKHLRAAEQMVSAFSSANDAGILTAPFIRAFDNYAKVNDDIAEELRRANLVIEILPAHVAIRKIVSKLYPIE